MFSGLDAGRGVNWQSLLFIFAGADFFIDLEPVLARLGGADRTTPLRAGKRTHTFAHWFFTDRAFREIGPFERSPQLERPTTELALAVQEFVTIQRHGPISARRFHQGLQLVSQLSRFFEALLPNRLIQSGLQVHLTIFDHGFRGFASMGVALLAITEDVLEHLPESFVAVGTAEPTGFAQVLGGKPANRTGRFPTRFFEQERLGTDFLKRLGLDDLSGIGDTDLIRQL